MPALSQLAPSSGIPTAAPATQTNQTPTMHSSSRPAAPPALALGDRQASSGSSYTTSSLGSAQTMPITYPRVGSPYSPTAYQTRKDSSGSTSSFSSSSSASKKVNPHRNAHTFCGRHTDQFLFSGFGKVWRHVTKRN